jgi:hypothetical protein
LVISDDNTIVGAAPLITKKFGIQFAKFVGGAWFPRDFIVEDQYRETCIAHILDFLFKTLRCQSVEFTLPAESPNLRILKQKCKASRIYFSANLATGHCIISVDCSWDEFEASRGKNFRRRFKKIGRHLNKAGSWRITCVENGDKEIDVFERILDVERRSWKEGWRTQRGMEIDPDLPMIWEGAQYTARTEPDFKWSVWFLELNDQTLAYTLVLQYKEVAFVIKTSYDERYKKFYPGLYVNNVAIRELFNKRQVRNIDLLADLPFHRTWTSMCLPRARVMMWRKGLIPNIIGSLLVSAYVRKILNVIPNPLLLRAHLWL